MSRLKIIEKRFLGYVDDVGGNGMSIYFRKPWSTFFGPHWEGPENLRKPRGFFGRNGKFESVCKYLVTGETIRHTALLTETSKRHCQLVRAFLVSINGEIFCECGLRSSHRGWCSHRVLNSPSRQAFLKNWRHNFLKTKTTLLSSKIGLEGKP